MHNPVPRCHFRDDLRTVGSVLLAIAAVLFLFVGSHTLANIVGDWMLNG